MKAWTWFSLTCGVISLLIVLLFWIIPPRRSQIPHPAVKIIKKTVKIPAKPSAKVPDPDYPFSIDFETVSSLTIHHLNLPKKILKNPSRVSIGSLEVMLNGLHIDALSVLNNFQPETRIDLTFKDGHRETWLFTGSRDYLMGCKKSNGQWYRFSIPYRDWLAQLDLIF